jgi:16S rRNA processing protein RimM
MGRVAAAFGVKGWIKVQPYTRAVDGLLEHPVWWLGTEGKWEKNNVVEGVVHGRSLIAKLAGYDDRDAAARVKGLDVAIPRTELPANADGEYYWSDLIGLEVSNREGVLLGRVVRVIETGASPVLAVEGTRERLIPLVGSVVLSVDVAGGRLTVDWGADF